MKGVQAIIDEYNNKTLAQLNAVDFIIDNSNDSPKSRARELKMIRKYPIYRDWVDALLRTNANLIKRINDLERKSDETKPEADIVSLSSGKLKIAEPLKNTFMQGKIPENVLQCDESGNVPESFEKCAITNESECGTQTSPSISTETVNPSPLKYCFGKFSRLFSKPAKQIDSKSVNHEVGAVTEQRNLQTQVIYIDHSACFVTSAPNTNHQPVLIQTICDPSICADIKSCCSEQINFLKSISNICSNGLQEKNDLLAAQMREIDQLKSVLLDYNDLKDSNNKLHRNIEALIAENAHIYMDLKLLKKNLRGLCKNGKRKNGKNASMNASSFSGV